MNKILDAKILLGHLSIVLLITVSICLFLYILGIPLVYWCTFGEGQIGAKTREMPINIFIENWGALFITLILCTTAIAYNNKKGKVSNAKSYLLTGVIVSVIYVFRITIIDLFIGI